MKTILCYGDSNTWGRRPGVVERFSWEERWTGLLQRELGDGVRVIEEGLRGRTTANEDPTRPGRNGKAYLPIVLESHSPIDQMILMLGTNDLKAQFQLSAEEIGERIRDLLEIVLEFQVQSENILLVSPPHVVPTGDVEMSKMFEGAILKSRELAVHFQRVAKDFHCSFFDAAQVASSNHLDGIHLDSEAQRFLAVAFARWSKHAAHRT